MSSSLRYAVTGANGQLGRLVVDALRERADPSQIIATVRDPSAVDDLRAAGVTIRQADYDRPETLDAAFAGVDRLLLISSNALGSRVRQHAAVIEAAKRAGVTLLAYTSILRADTCGMRLAEEHLATESLLAKSGLAYAILRNGWYTENHTAALPAVLEHGAVIGSSGEGRFAAAARADYAAAAAAVLVSDRDQNGRIYELAGDRAYTRAEFAAEVQRLSGKPVVYKDLPAEAYAEALAGFGLPAEVAAVIADADTWAGRGALDDTGRQLSALIGRPTTPWAKTVAAALAG